MATDLKEFDITASANPGSVSVLDYSVTTGSGQSDYWVSNTLVSYGAANFALDAAIEDIKTPSSKIEYGRSNFICSNPTIVIKNTGSTVLTSLIIEYWVNNNSTHQTYNWTGNLGFLETTDVTLPSPDIMWNSLNGTKNNTFNVEVKKPNNSDDGYSYNNKMKSTFDIPAVVPSNFVFNFLTNKVASENECKILDSNGKIVYSRTNMANSKQYKDTIKLGIGCYQLVITDEGGNGISFWANKDGNGSASFRKLSGSVIKTFQPDFGNSFIYNFTVDFPLSYEKLYKDDLFSVYPNPAKNQFMVQGDDVATGTLQVFNQTGQCMKIDVERNERIMIVNTSALANGLYFVVLTDNQGISNSSKVLIEN